MRTTVWLDCVCRLLDFHHSKDGKVDYADWMFEGGQCNLPVKAGFLTPDSKMKVFRFQVACAPVLQKFKTDDGKEYSLVCFRPMRGCYAENIQPLEE